MGLYLKINGIQVQVLDSAADRTREVIGTEERSVGTTIVQDRRAIKTAVEFRTPLVPRAEALAIEGLVEGAGHVFNFDASIYSAKGLGPSAGSSGLTLSGTPSPATSPKFGARGLSIGVGGSFSFRAAHRTLWTVSYWRWVSGTWVHYVETSSGLKFANGVTSSHTSVFTVSAVTPTASTFTAGANNALDDVCFCPYLWPSSWAAQVFSAGAAFGASPLLALSGDAFEYPFTAVGKIEKTVAQMAMLAGVPTEYRSVSFSVREN